MARVVLVHWNEAEARQRANLLTRARFQVEAPPVEQGSAGLRGVRDDPPDAFVIDLTRLPSHGRAVATALRQFKTTRRVPIVFIEGDAEKTARIREQLPDATFTGWDGVNAAIRHAIANPPATPVVPSTMGAYSGTPLPKKLGVREGIVMALLGAPKGFEKALGDVGKSIRLQTHARGKADLIMLFVKSRVELGRRLPAAIRLMADRAALWIAWPKKASGIQSDLSEEVVRKTGLDSGLVDYKICAIDGTWSGLRFARRNTK